MKTVTPALIALREICQSSNCVSESLRLDLTPSDVTERKNVVYQALTELEQLQERDTAKKVTKRYHRKELLTIPSLGSTFIEYIWGVCPSCDFENSKTSKQGYTIQHCQNCGQRLDWSDYK